MREVILNHLYRGIDEPESRILDVLVSKLRKKLAQATGGNHYIETQWSQVMCSATRPRCRLRHGSEPRGSHYASAARLLGAPLDCVRGSFEEAVAGDTRKNISECDALHTLPFRSRFKFMPPRSGEGARTSAGAEVAAWLYGLAMQRYEPAFRNARSTPGAA